MRIPIYYCNENEITYKKNNATQAIALYEVLNDVNSQENHSASHNYFGVRIVKKTSPSQILLYQSLFKRHRNCLFITTGTKITYANFFRLPWHKLSQLCLIFTCVYLISIGGFYKHKTNTLAHARANAESITEKLSRIHELPLSRISTQPLADFLTFLLESDIRVRTLYLTHANLRLSGEFSLDAVQTVASALNTLSNKIHFTKNGRVENISETTALWHINTDYEQQ